MYCGFTPDQFDQFGWRDVELLVTAFPHLQHPPVEGPDD